MKKLNKYAIWIMALLFTIYGQINIELDEKLLYLNAIILIFPIILSLFVYKIEKIRAEIEFTEIISTVVKIGLFSYLLYVPLSIIASVRITENPLNDYFMKLPSLIGHWIINSFLFIPILILATFLSFALLSLLRKRNKRL